MDLFFSFCIFFSSYFHGNAFGKIVKRYNKGIKRCLHTGMHAYTCKHTSTLYLGLQISVNYFEEIN